MTADRSPSALAIDVVSDLVCPFCLIGARRLASALADEGAEARITYQPFLLDPSAPPGGEDLRARLRAKYGRDPAPMFAAVEAMAREAGVPLDFAKVRRTCSTVAAQTLLRHAAPKGTQVALADALFDAYFLEGRDIGDRATLVELAAAHGFSADESSAILDDPAESAKTRELAAGAVAKGVRGVPHFVIDGRFVVSGAQAPAVFRAAIAKARDARRAG
jgi:predicted DsbA family dithiol-disulfide isomerase